MGESCCGSKPSAAPDRSHEDHGHDDHDHDHGHGHETHHHDRHHHGQGGGCCADSASISSSSTCCGDQERCDEKCVEAVAALECVKACEEDPGHDASSGHPHQHGASGHDSDTACSTHLQAAFDKYSSYLEQLRCICRSAVDNGATSFQTCCNKPKSKKNQHHSKSKRDIDIPAYKPSGTTGIKEVDVEKDGNTEPVSFLVSGMDCTSCADKLMRIFNTKTGVSQARVNFVVGSGEFTVDTSVTSADEVIAFASSVSGFNLSKVIGGNYFLDILAPLAEAKKMATESLPGVLDVQSLDKSTIRLAYDPAIIGARDLFARVEDRCRGLAQQQSDPQLVNSRRRLWDQLIKASLAAIFTIPVAVVAWSEDLVSERAEAIIGLTLGTVVQCIAIPEFYRSALSALWYSRAVEMDMLVVMSVTAAYVYSVIAFGFGMAGKPLDEGQFFETSTMLITLILLGRLIAAFARVQAVTAVSLRSKQQNVAVLVEKGGDREIDARLLHYGDRFRVLPHTRAPTDGVVVSGTTEVDESMLTGEPLPVPKKVNDSIIAGTMNGDGSVVVQLTRLPGKNTVTDIAQLVEDAANSKPKLQDLADKVAGWFVPAMAIVALLVFVIWIGCGLGVLRYSSGKAVGNAVAYAVATLAVACPCALGLAVPMVLVVAGGIAAKGGVIIKSAETTERARKVTDVVFDKTGTITEGDLVVVEEVVLSGDHSFNVSLAKALVAGGKHPVSAAVDKYLDGQAAETMAGVCNVRVVPGAGIEAEYKGNRLRAGNTRWTSASDVAEVARLQDAGLTVLVVTYNSVPVIAFGLSVQVRPEAQRVIAELKARNINVHLVSGDQKRAVQDVAASVGIPRENAVGEYTPPEKRDYVAALMGDEGRYVMFCGDGTNDAVAVAQANLGAQIGGSLTSSDVTQGAADVVLLNGLEGIPFLLNVSQASFHRMYFNFVWSAIYNVLAVTMASGAWVKFRIPPRYAGLGEMVSVVPVILAAVSMFLLNLKHKVSK